jgi:hypothetical protein
MLFWDEISHHYSCWFAMSSSNLTWCNLNF